MTCPHCRSLTCAPRYRDVDAWLVRVVYTCGGSGYENTTPPPVVVADRPTRKPMPVLARVCWGCGDLFQARHGGRRYCMRQCKNLAKVRARRLGLPSPAMRAAG